MDILDLNKNPSQIETASPSDLLKLSLTRFYANHQNVIRVKQVVSQKHRVSLRLIDWFVTNYSRITNVVIPNIIRPGEYLHVYNNYKQQLRSFGKQMFDPFRRDNKLTLVYGPNPDDKLETSLGQLNMFRWLFQYEIFEYIEQNIEAIESAMNASRTSNRKKIIVRPSSVVPTGPRVVTFD